MQGCLWAQGQRVTCGRVHHLGAEGARAGGQRQPRVSDGSPREAWRHVLRVRPRERSRGGLCLEAVGSSKALLFLSSFWVPIRAAGSLARRCVHRPLNMPPRGHEAQWTVLVVTHETWGAPTHNWPGRLGMGVGAARKAFLCLDNTEFPVPSLSSAVCLLCHQGHCWAGGASAQVLVWSPVGCVTLSRSLPSLGPSLLLKGGGLPGRTHTAPGGKVHHYG